jgi:hypothetical protein
MSVDFPILVIGFGLWLESCRVGDLVWFSKTFFPFKWFWLAEFLAGWAGMKKCPTSADLVLWLSPCVRTKVATS